MNVRSFLGSISVMLATSSAALAADIPSYKAAPAVSAPVPSFTWTGPYVGAQAGYGWLDADARLNGRSPGLKPDGFMLGGFAGYSYQFDDSPIVIGVETDINWSDADAQRGTSGFTGASDSRIKSDIGYTGAVRGRIGYAFDRFLVYGAGGLAYADTEVKASGAARGSDDTVAVGWTIGGGVEAAVTDNVTARVEYRYSDYGTDTFSVAGSRVKSDLTENRVMLGVGYKFSTGW